MSKTEKIYAYYTGKIDEFRDLVAAEFKKIINGNSSMYFHRVHELEIYGVRSGNKYVDKDTINLEERELELDRLGNKLGDNSYKSIENIVEEYAEKVAATKHYDNAYNIYLAKEMLNKLLMK